MQEQGNIAGSPVVQSVSVDAQLNVVLGLSYKDPGSAFSASLSVAVPAGVLLDGLVAKLNSPIATEVEQGLKAAIQMYLAAQPAQA